MTEPLLLSATQISTYDGERLLTRATGFFFARDERLFVVTSRHVVLDEPSKHFPSRVEIELHIAADNLTRSIGLSMPLYRDGKSIWRQGRDAGGEIDVAVLEVDREALPESVLLRAFTPDHLQDSLDEIEVGSALLIVGFPLGFHDTLHHLPVVRQAAIASSFGRLWLDYLLSRRGQSVLSTRSELFSIRSDVGGEFTAATLRDTLGASLNAITVGPALLVFLDQSKKSEFLRRWRRETGLVK